MSKEVGKLVPNHKVVTCNQCNF